MIPQNYLTQVVNLVPRHFINLFPLTKELIEFDAVVMLKPSSTIGTLQQGTYYFIKSLSEDQTKVRVKERNAKNLSGPLNLTNFNSVIGLTIPFTNLTLTKEKLKYYVIGDQVQRRLKHRGGNKKTLSILNQQARTILNLKDE